MRKTKNFFEPWTAEPRRVEVRDPDLSGLSEADACEIRAMVSAARVTQDHTIWGTGVWVRGESIGLLGDSGYDDGRGVMLAVRKVPASDSVISAKEMAERVCSCVNACQSITDPVVVLNGVRDLLRDLSLGDADPNDPRILSLLARMIPEDQVAAFRKG